MGCSARGRRLVTGLLGAVLSASVVAAGPGVAAGAAPAGAAPGSGAVEPHEPQVVPSVPGRDAGVLPLVADQATFASKVAGPQAPVVWPPAGVAEVELAVPSDPSSASSEDGVRAGLLPVRVAVLDETRDARVSSGATRDAQVPKGPAAQVPTGQGAPAAQGRVRVELADRAAAEMAGVRGVLLRLRLLDQGESKARVTVEYSGFRRAYGGDWASRLRMVRLDEGGTRHELPSRNDAAAGTVTADLDVSATDSTVAVTADPSGATGDYTATSLAPSGKWQVSANTGTFTWSYDMRTPPVPGQLAPKLAASYSSAAADGRVASTNNQPSWLGEGWSLGVGFIERSYQPCADDLGGNNGQTRTGDLCWETDNATLSLGSAASGELVPVGGGQWRPERDDGSRVERLTGAGNGATGEYWKVTTTDGTQYFFGRRTDSAWNVPVYGNDAGEPCNAAIFAASRCVQTYRWNLDYVVDTHGNSITYSYATESNQYAANLGASTVTYTRGGTLHRAEYGTRDGQLGTPPATVVFETADRCLTGAACSTHDATNWPDTPWDQECAAAPCTGRYSPTFWSTRRLAKITTYAGPAAVDEWVFDHRFPSPGDNTSAGLWLHGVTHSGLAGETPGSVALSAVTFGGTAYANRVNSATDGLPPLNKYRVTAVNNETGGTINVKYAAPDCAAGIRPAADTNGLRCFPVRWAFPPSTTPADDWFHKYVVEELSQVDRVGATLRQLTTYSYVGPAAWHYADNPLVAPERRTWSEFRGYEKVVIRTGDPAAEPGRPLSQAQHQYFRGMNGDKLAGGGTKSVSIVDSTNTALADDDPYAGFVREQITLDGAGGAVTEGTINTPWKRGPTAAQGTLQAFQVEKARTVTRTALATGGYRSTDVRSTFDDYGNPLTVDDLGGPGTADDRCTTTTYARNTTSWLLTLPSRVTAVGAACGATPAFPQDAISDERTYYDGGALGAAPTAGDVTRTEKVAMYSGSTPSYVTATRASYDAHGRVLDSFDAMDHKTTTAYTDTAGLTTSTVVTNPLGHATTTTLAPAWGLPLSTVDANGRRTDLTYDALGRLTAVWRPGRVKGNDGPNSRFTYGITGGGPNWVKTETLRAGNSLVAAFELYDGFLRKRQTQEPSAQGGRVLTDTLYDSRGLAHLTRAPYYNVAAPGGTVFLPQDNQVPSATRTLFDGAKRPVVSAFLRLNVEQWRTTTAYGGDHTDVTPPSGATPTSTYTDARGQTTALHQRGPAGADDVTTYGYTKAGLLATVTDPAGNTWRYGYDVRGRQSSADDPDKGLTTSTYDDLDRVLGTTDARGLTVTTSYDALGRRTELRRGPDTGGLLASWTWDTLSKGSLTSSTRFAGADAYTRRFTGYDAAGRPSGEDVVIPAAEAGLAGTYSSTMTYRADGSPASTKLPGLGDLPAETLVYGYGPLGLPSTLTGLSTYVGSTAYTALNESAQVALGAVGRRVWESTYYEEGTRRLSRLLTEREVAGSSAVDDLSYVYDPAGNVTRMADALAGSAADTQCFAYDHLRRATEAWTPSSGTCAAAPSVAGLGGPAPYWQSFRFDPTGNRTSQVAHGPGGDVTSTYAYPAAGAARPHAVRSVTTSGGGTVTYGYDAAGNLTDRNGQALTWDADGSLTAVGGLTNRPGQAPAGDAGGSSSTAGGTSYVYDADGALLLRRDPGGVTLFVGGGELRRTAGDAGTPKGTRYYGAVAVRTAAGVSWLVADHHGTSQVAVAAGTLAPVARRFDPFGVPRGSAPPWPGGERSFVGGPAEDSTGLVRLGAREYDPRLGRFLSVDPVIDTDDPQQLNAYAYANSNPASMSDPDGRKYFVDVDGLVTMPSLAHATPKTLAAVQRKLDRLAPMYRAREKARQAQRAAISRAAQHDWNGANGPRGRVGGYNSRAEPAWTPKPGRVMHKDVSLFGEITDSVGKAVSGTIGLASSAAAWGIHESVGRVFDPITAATGTTIGVCVGGGGAAFFMSVGGSACYIQSPDGSAAITMTANSAAGPGLGATMGAGPFVSNARNVDQVGGPFAHLEGSAAVVGGISGSFDFGQDSEGNFIWTSTIMPSIGAKASLGAGISDTWVLPHWFTPGNR